MPPLVPQRGRQLFPQANASGERALAAASKPSLRQSVFGAFDFLGLNKLPRTEAEARFQPIGARAARGSAAQEQRRSSGFVLNNYVAGRAEALERSGVARSASAPSFAGAVSPAVQAQARSQVRELLARGKIQAAFAQRRRRPPGLFGGLLGT
jgi:hypothetical protein